MKSYDVKFWAIRPGKAKTKRTHEVRWKVGARTLALTPAQVASPLAGGLRESGGTQISDPPASKNASTTHNAVSKPGQSVVVNEKQRCALLDSRWSHAAAV
ncbi:MAG: hypothetical protein ACRDOK_28155 [Streptosporangiaceae bacterium]